MAVAAGAIVVAHHAATSPVVEGARTRIVAEDAHLLDIADLGQAGGNDERFAGTARDGSVPTSATAAITRKPSANRFMIEFSPTEYLPKSAKQKLRGK